MSAALQNLNSQDDDIVHQIRALYRACLARAIDSVVLDGLDRLNAALDSHFEEESVLMEATGFAQRAFHEEQHDLIRNLIRKLTGAVRGGNRAMFLAEVPFVVHVVLQHKTCDDHKLHEHLRRQPIHAAAGIHAAAHI